MAAGGLPDATEEILRDLARAVSSHRRAGGALDDLPPRQQELLRAMDDAQRRFFLEELAKADAEAEGTASGRRWAGGATGGPAPTTIPSEGRRMAPAGIHRRDAAKRGAEASADPPERTCRRSGTDVEPDAANRPTAS